MDEEPDPTEYMLDDGFGEECAAMNLVTQFTRNTQSKTLGLRSNYLYDAHNDALYTNPNRFKYGGYA